MSRARKALQFFDRSGPVTKHEVMGALRLDGKQASNLLNYLRLRSFIVYDSDSETWGLRRRKVPSITLSAWAVTPELLDRIESSVKQIDEFCGSSSDQLLADIRRVREYLGETPTKEIS